MQSEYRLAIKIGLVALFFIVRQIYKSANSGTKEVSITSTLDIDKNLVDKLQMQPGELVSLVNRPNTFEVIVRAKGTSGTYEEIGIIEDRELAEKVKNHTARGKIEYADGTNVKLTFTY